MSLIYTSNPIAAVDRVRTRANSIHPNLKLDDSNSLPDLLNSLPILSKMDLGLHLPPKREWLASAVLFSETSGTTGHPLETPRGMLDLTWNASNQVLAYKRFLQPGVDRVAILHPSILSPFIEASANALRQLNIGQIRVYPIPLVCDYQRIFDVLEKYEITTIMSTPSLVYKLLYEFKNSGVKNIPSSLCNLLLTGEYLSQSNIKNFHRILGKNSLVVPFVYGSSEAATLMLGRKDGLFDLLCDDFVFEFHASEIEDKRNKLIVTWLRDGLMPILRYDTGDYFNIDNTGANIVCEFAGRDEAGNAVYEMKNNIEYAIYSLSNIIYHYECSINFRNQNLNLILYAEMNINSNLLTCEITEKLKYLNVDWKVSISVNPSEGDFLKFSPSPKTKKFVIC